MSYHTVSHLFEDEIYLAGEFVLPGAYIEIETGVEIELDQEGYLPAALNGRATAYVCKPYAWGRMQARNERTGSLTGESERVLRARLFAQPT